MPISDLLWGCPACGKDRGLTGDPPVCGACETRFLTGPNATIRAVASDGSETVRSAPEWLERLPDPASLLHDDPIRTARASIRTAIDEKKVFGAAGYLNRVEVLGEEVDGILRLERDRLVLTPEGKEQALQEAQGPAEPGEPGEPEVWPLETITAVQTSSKSLQVKRRHRPLVSFRFKDDAVFLWERLLRAALRDFYGRTGRGEIREFQPRIETRAAR